MFFSLVLQQKLALSVNGNIIKMYKNVLSEKFIELTNV